MSTQKSSTLPYSGEEETKEISVSTVEEEYKARALTSDEIHSNWGVILPMLQGVDPDTWNGTYAKLLRGDCKAILVTNGNKAVLCAIITIGKHGATSGFNTCFVDALGINKDSGSVNKALKAGLDCVLDIARANKCDGILGDTPSKQVADMAKSLGFVSTPMFKLGRYVNG